MAMTILVTGATDKVGDRIADASMKRFAGAPATAQFMAIIAPDSMVITRHGK